MKKKIFISGNFNVLHPGHLRLFKFAKELGDVLVVGINSDSVGGSAIHVPENMRLDNVDSNIWVDETILIEDSIEQVLKSVRPDIVLKGKEYEGIFNPEKEILDSYGGKLIFSSGEVVFSSFDLISNYYKSEAHSTVDIPQRFLKRHGFDKNDLKNVVESFTSLKVCVIGDLIVDEYISCDPLGMSQEDPTIVVTPIDSKSFIGGAGIVAAHAAGLGAEVDFISIGGDDKSLSFAKEVLNTYKINHHIFVDEIRPTTLKQRFRSHDKTLLRVSHLHQGAINLNLQNEIYELLSEKIENYDLLVFSDFNYGCLPQTLVDRLVKKGKDSKVIMAADSQSSSQMGDISRFKGMDFLFPTEHEARLSLRNYDDGLVILSEKLSKKADAANIFLKLGSEGVLLHLKDANSIHSQTDRLRALNNFPKDVSGAGDSMMIAALLSHISGASGWVSACLGSLASAIQIGRLGNIPLQKEDLLKSL
tara:strand:+ start:199 stop:1626 length:1428 start_codon:yes stop_codon:yes gene_type:complete